MTDDSGAESSRVLTLILAGGESRRFGTDKATAYRPDGTRFLDAVVSAVEPVSDAIVILGSARSVMNGIAEVTWWSEPTRGGGPLSAVSQWVFAQPHLTAPRYLVIACDYPFADAGAVARLLSLQARANLGHLNDDADASASFDVVLPHAEGYAHPLFACYSRTGIERLALLGTQRRSMMKALRELSSLRLMIPSSCAKPYRNVNRPEELSFAE